MELNNLEMKSGAQKLVIKNPLDGTDTDIVIFVRSPHSVEFKNKSIEIARARLATSKQEDLDHSYIAALVGGWENIVIDKKKIAFSFEEAVNIFNRYPWMADQVQSFADKTKNFIKGSGKK